MKMHTQRDPRPAVTVNIWLRTARSAYTRPDLFPASAHWSASRRPDLFPASANRSAAGRRPRQFLASAFKDVVNRYKMNKPATAKRGMWIKKVL